MKKILLYILSLTLAMFFTYVAFILFLIDDNTRDYKEPCSRYIPLLEQIYKKNGNYPASLDEQLIITDYEFSLKECRYQILKPHEYIFSVTSGFGVAGYNSISGRWWFD